MGKECLKMGETMEYLADIGAFIWLSAGQEVF